MAAITSVAQALECSDTGGFQSAPFPLVQNGVLGTARSSQGAPVFGAAQRTLDGEDRSPMLVMQGKGRPGEHALPRVSAADGAAISGTGQAGAEIQQARCEPRRTPREGAGGR